MYIKNSRRASGGFNLLGYATVVCYQSTISSFHELGLSRFYHCDHCCGSYVIRQLRNERTQL